MDVPVPRRFLPRFPAKAPPSKPPVAHGEGVVYLSGPPMPGFRSSLLALLLVPLAAGCHARGEGTAPSPSAGTPSGLVMGSEDRAYLLGELGVAPDFTMSVESDKECPEATAFAPKRGFIKFGVEVSISGTSTVEVPVNPFYATLHDSTGDVYTSNLAGCDPGLPAVRVTTGKKARGFVTFEIPTMSRKLELRYAPTIIGRTGEELKFTVTR